MEVVEDYRDNFMQESLNSAAMTRNAHDKLPKTAGTSAQPKNKMSQQQRLAS